MIQIHRFKEEIQGCYVLRTIRTYYARNLNRVCTHTCVHVMYSTTPPVQVQYSCKANQAQKKFVYRYLQ